GSLGDKPSLWLLHEFDVAHAVYTASYAKALKAIETSHGFDFTPGDAIMHGLDKPEQDALVELSSRLDSTVAADTKRALTAESTTTWLSIAAFVLAALAGCAI